MTITERLQQLADDPTSLTADELTQLSADIRAAYEQARSDGPADGEDGKDYAATLIAYRDGLAAVTQRQGELATEQAEADETLANLDAEMATLAGDLSTEDAEALGALSDEDQATLRDLDEDGRTALGEWVTAVAEADTPVEPEPEQPAAEVVELVTEPETPVVTEDEADRLQRAAAALRNRRPAAQPQPADERPEAVSLIRTFDEGTPLDEQGLARRVASAISRYGNTPGREVRVASIGLGPDVPRVEDITDPSAWFNEQLRDLRAHRRQAINAAASGTRQASGAMCAPPLTDYTVVGLGTADRPVRALFPTAGGSEADNNKTLEFFQAIGIYDFEDANGDILGADDQTNNTTASTKGIGAATATENALALNNAASPYPKTAFRVACPTPVTCEQRLVWLELIWDNLNAASWPELVSAVGDAGQAALAREHTEWDLEDWYDAADAADLVLAPQTTGQGYSSNHSIVQALVTLATVDRRDKNDTAAPYVALIPDWAEASMASEMLAMLDIASGSMSVDQARAEILNRFDITVSTYATAFGKSTAARTTSNAFSTVLPRLNASSLTPQFPCEARIAVARDDAAFVRQGLELNLGVLRTEDDIENNDHRTFYEVGSRVCFRIPPIVADVRTNASAAVAAGITPIDNCAGSGS